MGETERGDEQIYVIPVRMAPREPVQPPPSTIRQSNHLQQPRMVQSKHILRQFKLSTKQLWHIINPRLYHGAQRLLRSTLLGVIILVLCIAAALPMLLGYLQSRSYHLNSATEQLLGPLNPTLANKITFDTTSQTYYFNQSDIGASQSTVGPEHIPIKLLQNQLGAGAAHTNTPYSVKLPVNGQQGITYYDNNTGLSFTLVPNFTIGSARQVNHRIVYAVPGGVQLIYTPEVNGLREDYVLTKPLNNSLHLSYTLKLPNTLAAQILPNNNGVGIYSANPQLYGQISYGDQATEASVMKARVSSIKNNLVFAIPSPTLNQSSTSTQRIAATAQLALQNTNLIVNASSLQRLTYPASLDPSVVVNSASAFQTGNNEGSIDFGDTGTSISRANLTGGSVSAGWTDQTTTQATRTYSCILAYNGYLYDIGGVNGSGNVDTIDYYSINSSTGALTYVNTVATAADQSNCSGTIYNGYLYEVTNGTSTALYYSKIQSNGSLGSWTSTNIFSDSVVAEEYLAAAGGFMYIVGGCTHSSANHCTSSTTTVQYTTINANGSLSTWSSTTSLPSSSSIGQYDNPTFAYNGYLYSIAGDNANTATSSVEAAPITSSGTIGGWQAYTSLPNTCDDFAATMYDGFLYVGGGNCASIGVNNDVFYTVVSDNGSLGSWTTTTTFTTARLRNSMTFYNGFLYLADGANSGLTTYFSDKEYAQIDTMGNAASPSTTYSSILTSAGTGFTSARDAAAVVAYDGFLYVMGGNTGGTYYNTIQFAPINSNGTIGTWSTEAATLPHNLTGLAAVAYNNFMYILGGYDGTTTYANVYSSPICTDLQVNASCSGHATGYVLGWTALNSMSVSAMFLAATVYDGYLYAAGGCENAAAGCTTVQGNIESAQICTGLNSSTCGSSSNSVISSWNATAATLPHAVYSLDMVASNGFIYVMGGNNVGTFYNNVSYATISIAGVIGSSWTSTNNLVSNLSQMAAIVYKGDIYYMGGVNSSSVYSSAIYYAPICTGSNNGVDGCGSTAGPVGTWLNDNETLPQGVGELGIAVYGDNIYAAGGCYKTTSTCDTWSNTVSYGQINNAGNGGVGSWNAINSFTTARTFPGAVAYNGYLYMMGGCDGTGATGAVCATNLVDVQYAAICTGANTVDSCTTSSTPGSVGAWNTNGNSLLEGGSSGNAFAYNGYLYYIAPEASSSTNNVQYALICTGSNTTGGCSVSSTPGSVGTWASTTNYPITGSYFSFGSAMWNGYLYVVGGISGSTYQTAVSYAQIQSNGTVGSWSSTTGLPTVTEGLQAITYNGYIYALGGFTNANTTGFLGDVLYAPINSNGTIGSWAATTSFINPRAFFGVAAFNGNLYVLDGCTNSTCGVNGTNNFFNDVQVAPVNANGELGPWLQTNTFTTAREGANTATSNGFLYLLGGDTTSGSTETFYATTQLANLTTIARSGTYSDLVDLGSNASALDSITYTGSLTDGTSDITYKEASAIGSNAFTFTSPSTAATLNASTVGACAVDNSGTGVRYVWLSINLYTPTGIVAFPDSTGDSPKVVLSVRIRPPLPQITYIAYR